MPVVLVTHYRGDNNFPCLLSQWLPLLRGGRLDTGDFSLLISQEKPSPTLSMIRPELSEMTEKVRNDFCSGVRFPYLGQLTFQGALTAYQVGRILARANPPQRLSSDSLLSDDCCPCSGVEPNFL